MNEAIAFYDKCKNTRERLRKSKGESAPSCFKLPKRLSHGKVINFNAHQRNRINMELKEALEKRQAIFQKAKTSYYHLSQVLQSHWNDGDRDFIQDLVNHRNKILARRPIENYVTQITVGSTTGKAVQFMSDLEKIAKLVELAREQNFNNFIVPDDLVEAAQEYCDREKARGNNNVNFDSQNINLLPFLGNSLCKNNALDKHLKCAVNPSVDCNICQYFESR